MLFARISIAILVLAPLARAQTDAAPKKGDVILQQPFDSDRLPAGWRGAGTIERGALLIERTGQPASGAAMCQFALPVERLRGCAVYCSARVRADNVSAKLNAWNGVKVMLAIESTGGKSWPQADLQTGSFDFRKATFIARIPADATKLTLFLGLENVTGRVWFDDVRITVRQAPGRLRPIIAATRPAFRTTLRGAMVGPRIDEASLRTFGQEWNANLIRWQLVNTSGREPFLPLAAYDRWLEGELSRLDAALESCRKYGLRVVVDLHSPPGGRRIEGGYIAANAGLFSDKDAQSKFIEVWQRIARRYKGNSTIWGFDLVNEPVEDSADEALDDWHDLAERAGKAIRAIDPDRTLIVEPPEWGGPRGLVDFEPIDLPNIVYSVHMYVPHAFTHQGVYRPSQPIEYPGLIEGKRWDKAALEAELKPVIDFQNRCGVPIYLGEFSVIRWAPGESGARYLKDCIDIFEANGWNWTYHAFREWNGWSVEHGPDRADDRPTTRPTSRQRLLRDYFARNAR